MVTVLFTNSRSLGVRLSEGCAFTNGNGMENVTDGIRNAVTAVSTL